MATLDELEQKLEDAQLEARRALSELQSFGSVRESLEGARGTIRASAADLNVTVNELRRSISAFDKFSSAAKQSAEALGRADPLEVSKSLTRLEKRVDDFDSTLKAMSDTTLGRLESFERESHDVLKTQSKETLSEITSLKETLQADIQNQVERAEDNLKKQFKASTKSNRVLMTLLAIAVGTVAMLSGAFRF